MAAHDWRKIVAKEVQRACLSVVVRDDTGTGAIFGRKLPHGSRDLVHLFLPSEAVRVELRQCLVSRPSRLAASSAASSFILRLTHGAS